MKIKNFFLILLISYTLDLYNQIPKVSIITSLYKSKEFIRSFMADIIKQTIFNQCELIIINANSPNKDTEKQVIAPYLKKYPNILYFELDEDPGIYAIWNLAIQLSQGEYITNANADDRLRHDCYQIYAQFLDTHPYIDLVYSNFYVSYRFLETFAQAENLFYTQKETIELLKMPPFSLEHLKICCLPNDHPMWRKSMHEKYGFFDPTFKSAGDYEFWLRAVRLGAKFHGISKPLGVHFVNPCGLSTNPSTIKQRKLEGEEIKKRKELFLTLRVDPKKTYPELFY